MSRFTDQDLVDLKLRTIQASAHQTNIGNSNQYILDLIEEIQDLRKVPTTLMGTLKISDLGIKRPVVEVVDESAPMSVAPITPAPRAVKEPVPSNPKIEVAEPVVEEIKEPVVEEVPVVVEETKEPSPRTTISEAPPPLPKKKGKN